MSKNSISDFFSTHVKKGERILVTGATGWFGRTALMMLRDYSSSVLAVSSKSGILELPGFRVNTLVQNLDMISEFSPTLVIDSAFVTRDRLNSLAVDDYISINRSLIEQSVLMASLPSVKKYVGFSSGATKHLAGQGSFALEANPYAALKKEYENQMTQMNSTGDVAISIARVWSVSGPFTTKPHLFAFSNLISQAKRGVIQIDSSGKVFRRYCGLENVLLVALAQGKQSGDPVFDTGGELIEIGDLAEVIRKEINKDAVVMRKFNDWSDVDDYYSDGTQWESLISKHGIDFETIPSQIRRSIKFD